MKKKILTILALVVSLSSIFYCLSTDWKDRGDSDPKKRLRVAVIDSGIDTDHLNVPVVERFVTNKDELDSFGHGTAVTGLIHKNNKNIDYYDANILDEKGHTDIHTLIKSLDWCIKNKVNLINMSFGLNEDNERLKNKINEVVNENIIIIAAAGNKLGFQSDYPARYKNVISISAVDSKHNVYKFASKGKVDFVSPGVNVHTVKIKKLSKIKNLSGTSFATGYATGYISNFVPDNFSLTRKDLISKLKKQTNIKKQHSRDSAYGYGLLIK